jgi:anthranilate phosphoribosyltransferase
MPVTLNLHQALERLLDRKDLTEQEAAAVLRAMTDETVPAATSGAVLVALRSKGETAAEVRGFAGAMRELSRRVVLPAGMPAADIVGTGGDSSGSFNLSTGTALLAAGCGVPIVKHGNRSISSRSGSADVLEQLGVPLVADPAAALACLEACNFAFLFAPNFHPATRALAPVRRALGVRTVFNILGPLTNPAAPPFHLIGAFDLPTAELLANALAGMDIRRAFVVHGEPGWDEATPVGPFVLFDVRDGKIRREQRDPADAGIPRCEPSALQGGDAAANAAALEAVLQGRDRGPHRDALLLGAALVLELTGRVNDPGEGVRLARQSLEDGAGARVLEDLRAFGRRSSPLRPTAKP